MKLLVFDTSNSTCCAGLYEMEFGGSVKEIAYEISMEKGLIRRSSFRWWIKSLIRRESLIKALIFTV